MAETETIEEVPEETSREEEGAPFVYENRRHIEAWADRYRLVLPDRHRSAQMGDLSGRSTGSSIEYQDRKDYVPGDDVRHVDWRAFARNDRLTIKLYREEITPRIDMIIDTSLSMEVTPEKAARRLDMTYFFYLMSRKFHAAVQLLDLGEKLERFQDPLELLVRKNLRQDSPMPLLQKARVARTGGVKIIVSDFLFPFAPDDLARIFSAADRLIMVQIVSEFEDNPPRGGEVRLQDAESGAFLDVALNKVTVEGYKKRLHNLRNDLDRRLRTMGGAFVVLRDTDTLEETMRSLLEAGIVEV